MNNAFTRLAYVTHKLTHIALIISAVGLNANDFGDRVASFCSLYA